MQLVECCYWIYVSATECVSRAACKSHPIRVAYFTCCKMFIYRNGEEGVSLRKSLEIQYAVQLWCVIACKILISIQPLGKAQEMAWPLSPLSLASSWLWQTTLSGEQKGVIHAIFHSKCLSLDPHSLGFRGTPAFPDFSWATPVITTSASAEIIKHSLPDADVFHLFSKCFALFTSQKWIWNPRNMFRKSKKLSRHKWLFRLNKWALILMECLLVIM